MLCSLAFGLFGKVTVYQWHNNVYVLYRLSLCFSFFSLEICQFSCVATRQFDLFQCSGYYNSSMQANDEILLKPVLLLKLSVENWERTKLMLKCNTTAVLYASVVSNSSTSKQPVKPFTPSCGPLWRLALLY